MKKSLVYLESMSPDGTPGAVREVEYDETPSQYLEPVPYFASNDATLDAARKKVATAETELRHAVSRNAPATEIMRLEETLRSLKVELDATQSPRRQQRARETGIGQNALLMAENSATLGWDFFLKNPHLQPA
jgi:hypothetical protein